MSWLLVCLDRDAPDAAPPPTSVSRDRKWSAGSERLRPELGKTFLAGGLVAHVMDDVVLGPVTCKSKCLIGAKQPALALLRNYHRSLKSRNYLADVDHCDEMVTRHRVDTNTMAILSLRYSAPPDRLRTQSPAAALVKLLAGPG